MVAVLVWFGSSHALAWFGVHANGNTQRNIFHARIDKVRIHWKMFWQSSTNSLDKWQSFGNTTDKCQWFWKWHWRCIGKCHWKCHWKSMMISEVLISGVLYVAPKIWLRTFVSSQLTVRRVSTDHLVMSVYIWYRQLVSTGMWQIWLARITWHYLNIAQAVLLPKVISAILR